MAAGPDHDEIGGTLGGLRLDHRGGVALADHHLYLELLGAQRLGEALEILFGFAPHWVQKSGGR